MFMEVREQKGLCYSISTSTDFYSDAGCISTHAGVDLKRVPQAIEAIMVEYGRIAREGPTAEEVTKAKNYLKGKLTLRFEDSEELASYYGTQSILLNRLRSVDAAFAKVDAVTRDEIHLAAQTLFQPEYCRLAAIGPFDGRQSEFEALLSF
jgi:predicted Zn-dependent peptidase